MTTSKKLRTTLANAKGLGSAKDGLHHWIWQRLTALVMIPLTVWFMTSVVMMVRSTDPLDISYWMSSPYNAILSVIMFAAMFYHAKLGMQVVIEDYIHKPCIKITALVLNYMIFAFAAVISIIAISKLHFLG